MNTNQWLRKLLWACGLLPGLALSGCRMSTVVHNNGSVNNVVRVNGHTVNTDSDRNRVKTENRQTVQGGRVKALNVRGDTGNITVTAAVGGANQITIHAIMQVEGNRPEAELRALLPKLRVPLTVKDDKLIVTSEHPRAWDNQDIGVSVSYEITVPASLPVTVTDVNGSVNVQGMQGGVEVTTESGNVQLNEVMGAIHATTTNGSVELEHASRCTEVRLRTESGNLTANHVEGNGTPPSVDIVTTNGSVEYVGNATGLILATTSGNVHATLNGSPYGAHISSVNGSVDLRLPPNVSAQVTANTTNGTVTLPHATRDSERTSAQATFGTGRATITLTTTNGNITVEAP